MQSKRVNVGYIELLDVLRALDLDGARGPSERLASLEASLLQLVSSVDESTLAPADQALLVGLGSRRRARPSGIAPTNLHESLCRRERQTLELLLTGASEKEIAAQLGLSVHTVHQYVKAIYRRFDVTSRAQLMARSLRAS